ncbi:putative gp38 protein [Burkholderia gladioli]|uniref:Gp38 n=1 Tax=Burkholderia gladioli TaxID=28095 RepID=A0AAW3F2B8_BURGA|nr:hypothetical protein [Burkholderia gladioli]KGC14010.1 putative gp38 protein [Burkholderia gladioli]
MTNNTTADLDRDIAHLIDSSENGIARVPRETLVRLRELFALQHSPIRDEQREAARKRVAAFMDAYSILRGADQEKIHSINFTPLLVADLRALLTSPRAGVPAPKGWKLVPIEATREMADSGHLAYDEHGWSGFKKIWSAMLDAAPAAPVAEPQTDNAANLITIDRRDLYGFVRGSIKRALEDASHGAAESHEPMSAVDCWSEAHTRTIEIFDSMKIAGIGEVQSAAQAVDAPVRVASIHDFGPVPLGEGQDATSTIQQALDCPTRDWTVPEIAAQAVAADGEATDEDRIDWIANAHCPGGMAYPVNVKNAIREALREARAAVSPATRMLNACDANALRTAIDAAEIAKFIDAERAVELRDIVMHAAVSPPADKIIQHLESSVLRYQRMVDELKQRLSQVVHSEADAANERAAVSPATAEPWKAPKQHCQNGGDVCLAGNRDGVCCPEDSCDIDDGTRKNPATADERAAKLDFSLLARLSARIMGCPINPALSKFARAVEVAARESQAAAPQANAAEESEDAYVIRRLSETLADVCVTLRGEDPVHPDDPLNKIELVKRLAEVLRMEVELYRAQAAAPASMPAFKRYNWDGKEHEAGPLVFFLDVLEALKIVEDEQAAAPAEAREPDAYMTLDCVSLKPASVYLDREDIADMRPDHVVPLYRGAVPADAGEAVLPPKRVEEIMAQAQVLASAWSLVGGRFDQGDALETAEQEKQNLRDLVSGAQGGKGGEA